MKKGSYFTIILSCLFSSCTLGNNTNTNASYEDKIFSHLKIYDKVNFQQSSVENGEYVVYYLTPSGFEYDKLIENGYHQLDIVVHYDVDYKKSFDGWDIIYISAPKYDVIIKNQDSLGTENIGLEINKTKSNYISYSSNLVDYINNRITIKFGSTNIQNIIYFYNIYAEYFVK